MKPSGLLETDLRYMVSIFTSAPQIEKVILFGSRAMGNYKRGSDVDIAIVGKDIDFSITARIHSLLEEQSPMPYFFDVVDYTHLKNIDMKKHIDNFGNVIYSKKN